MPVKVLFIGSEDEENLSIRYPAAVLVKAGHTVEIAPFSVPEDTDGSSNKSKNSARTSSPSPWRSRAGHRHSST